MNKFRFTLKISAIAIFMFAFASLAQAQATRTWVSGVGDDVNPCSRTAPCKTFAGAISKTAKDGEIDALDPAGYGAVTIVKSITINGGGTGQGFGSILASGVNGVIVNITDPADIRKTVRLNWLDINGASTGLNGVQFLGGSVLYVENTVIDGFTQNGINHPSSTVNGNEIHLRNVVIRNCVGNGVNIVNSSTNTTNMTAESINVTRTNNGFFGGNGTKGQIARSFFGSNQVGISGASGAATTDFSVVDTSVTLNTTGISTGASTTISIARCAITGNTNALGLGGSINTGGNNTIMSNGTDQNPNGAVKIQN
jgi:hypothetical protein